MKIDSAFKKRVNAKSLLKGASIFIGTKHSKINIFRLENGGFYVRSKSHAKRALGTAGVGLDVKRRPWPPYVKSKSFGTFVGAQLSTLVALARHLGQRCHTLVASTTRDTRSLQTRTLARQRFTLQTSRTFQVAIARHTSVLLGLVVLGFALTRAGPLVAVGAEVFALVALARPTNVRLFAPPFGWTRLLEKLHAGFVSILAELALESSWT